MNENIIQCMFIIVHIPSSYYTNILISLIIEVKNINKITELLKQLVSVSTIKLPLEIGINAFYVAFKMIKLCI